MCANELVDKGAESNVNRDKVLLIGASPVESAMIIGIFRENYPDAHIEGVQDGVAGLDCLFGTGRYTDQPPSTPSLVMLTITLPTLSSGDFLRITKGYVRTCSIPIIVLARSANDRLQEIVQLGVVGVVYPPVNSSQLRQVLQATQSLWYHPPWSATTANTA